MLHHVELPFRHLFMQLDGTTSGKREYIKNFSNIMIPFNDM
jgi:hypothetical protein